MNSDLHGNRVKAVRVDKIVYRLDLAGNCVGLALKMTNGRWGLFDSDERRIGKNTFATPKEVADALDIRLCGQSNT